MSVARTLFQRAESLTSNRVARNNERDHVFNVLGGSNYPRSFLYCLQAPVATKCNSFAGDSLKGFAVVPYTSKELRNQSEGS